MNYLQKITLFFVFSFAFSIETAFAEELLHIVRKGETVYSISRFYNVTPDELMGKNNISDPLKLQVGKQLTIPSSADIAPSSPIVYKDYHIRKGDTLFSIARTHGITLADLQDLNKISIDHIIKIGDTIKVPGNDVNNSTNSPPTKPSTNSPVLSEEVLSLLWPIRAKEITYMTGQMGVVVEGQYSEPVKSISQGKVISAGPWRKFGKVAIVETAEGYLYMYGGCESLTVDVGDKIFAGMELGKLGVNAVSEKPQLFFMVFRNEAPIDPAKAPRTLSNVKT